MSLIDIRETTDRSTPLKVPEKPKMIKVTKLPIDTTEDNLTFYFENTRRSGGGEVENVTFDPDTQTAIITFKDDDGKCSVNACS